jgi:hypothetical protein
MDITTYALSKKYTDKTVVGLGALKGAPCTVSNISETDTEITLTLSWTGTDGTNETSILTIFVFATLLLSNANILLKIQRVSL